MFKRIVIGVEGSPESLVAVRQAARLLEPDGGLVLAAVAEVALAVDAGWAATRVLDDIDDEARSALASAWAEAPAADTLLLDGSPANGLLETARSRRADLLAVGTHGGSRATGILLGSVATLLLHEAPCSVLVARPSPDDAEFPRNICVGVDGSPGSARAAEVARELAQRFDARLARIAACGGMKINLDELFSVEPNVRLDHRPAVEALVERAAEGDADLLVVGSRGLHGVAALGSVSERVAHRARCSVLVVRDEEN
jgi:nucleotide-binding universal stress UspA family protein